MKNLFVTSTGTEIGKTIASEYLVKCLDRSPGSVGYFKPVASGCGSTDWGYRSPDEVQIIQSTSLTPSDVHAAVRFDAPLSPDKAAEKENERIDPDPILKHYDNLNETYESVIVEGIGGVAVPFTPSYDVRDLIADLELPVLLVVSSGLGTISHTRTAMAYLDQKNVETSGILLTPDQGEEIHTLNRDHLREFYPGREIRLLPDVNSVSEDEIIDLLDSAFVT